MIFNILYKMYNLQNGQFSETLPVYTYTLLVKRFMNCFFCLSTIARHPKAIQYKSALLSTYPFSSHEPGLTSSHGQEIGLFDLRTLASRAC